MSLNKRICYNEKIRSFTEAICYLERAEKLGVKFGLERVIKACAYFGDPQAELPVIHVAGTNGKGSVCAFVACILQKAGFKTGLYSSPHLIDIEERIQINGKPISKKDFAVIIGRIAQAAEWLELSLTYFEILTVAAFIYFKERQVDLAVLEVGMGGRLDATNIVENPAVSVITNIDFDHMQFLGNTLAKIAGEKAAIIKRGGLLVTAASQSEVLGLIKKRCLALDSLFWRVGKDSRLPVAKLGLPGDYQKINAACAVAVIKGLRLRGFTVPQQAVRQGLAAASWPGRFEIFGGKVILDGAHNPAGAKVLVASLRGKFGPRVKLVLVYGVLGDKNYPEMIKILGAVAAAAVLVKPESPRALRPKKMLAKWRQYIGAENVSIAADMGSALDLARKKAGKTGLVCVCGSLYVVGAARKLLLKARRGGKKHG